MHLHADTVTVDDDEGRFTLEISTEELGAITVNIHGIDLDAFYDQVRGRIGPYLREAYEARRTAPVAFLCDPDESAGAYELSDPKHPRFHSVHADLWDMREGK